MDNKQSESVSAWPTATAVFAVLAVIVSALCLAVVIGKDNVKTVVAAGASTGSTAAPPGIQMGNTPADGFVARDASTKPSPQPAGTVHKETFTIEEKQLEIAPGVTQLMWTFNGTVPGPILRGKVGDTFQITVVNKGSMPHSIDFHASKVAPNVMMREIAPGKSLVYTFTADHAGIFMYHCGTPPVLQHIAMGMYGAVIIDPPNLPPVDHEYVMLQSELYKEADPTQPVDFTKLLDEQWDAVVFNGYVNQYVDRPIHVGVNQKVRVWVMDEGPSENSSFHVIGTIFDTTYKEGVYLLQPDANRGGSQTLDLQPAQGGFVEFTFAVPGTYPFVTHKFASASKGAAGKFIADGS
jgi:nitrite reductase (NO-forming)